MSFTNSEDREPTPDDPGPESRDRYSEARDLAGGEDPLECLTRIAETVGYAAGEGFNPLTDMGPQRLSEAVKDRLAGKDEALRLEREQRERTEGMMRTAVQELGSPENADNPSLLRELVADAVEAFRAALSDSPRPDTGEATVEWRATASHVDGRSWVWECPWRPTRAEAEHDRDNMYPPYRRRRLERRTVSAPQRVKEES